MIEVGTLDTVHDFLDVRDVCAAYGRTLECAASLPPCCIINLACGRDRRIGNLLYEMSRIAWVSVGIRTDPARLRHSEVQIATGSSDLARRLLDGTPQIPWEQTISDILADWRQRVRAA